MGTMQEAGNLRPFFVLEASPSGRVFANHLAIQDFHLKRAMVQLKELAQVLVN
jgi:hypothetical protein